MSSLREEIVQEMEHPRVDKNRMFALLLKIVDNAGAGGIGPMGPPGPVGPLALKVNAVPLVNVAPLVNPNKIPKLHPHLLRKRRLSLKE